MITGQITYTFCFGLLLVICFWMASSYQNIGLMRSWTANLLRIFSFLMCVGGILGVWFYVPYDKTRFVDSLNNIDEKELQRTQGRYWKLTQDQKDQNILYVQHKDGVWKSVNYGNTWTKLEAK